MTTEWTRQQRDIALRKARSFAGDGNFVWCQSWINRASSFYPVTKRQLNNIQRKFDAATQGKRLDCRRKCDA